MLVFGQYLKTCRENLPLSQRQLVNYLNDFDSAFACLDSTTLSRWERNVNLPSLNKQTLLMKYFADRYQRLYPFIYEQPFSNITKQLFSHRFVAATEQQQLIVKCPIDQIDHRHFQIHNINQSNHRLAAINHNLHIYSQLHQRNLALEQHNDLLKIPANVFMVCDYFDQYLGHLFVLKLKAASFHQILHYEKLENSICSDDIAAIDEPGFYYIFGLFCLSSAVASLLICRLYALLIKNQMDIEGIGWLTYSAEQRDWAMHIGMQPCIHKTDEKKGPKLVFRAATDELLLSDTLIKLLFEQKPLH